MTNDAEADLRPLFRPLTLGGKTLRNRTVMAPMTRALSPGGVPNADVVDYYRKRAAGGVGLIVTEGTWVPHPTASNDPMVPRFHGDDALAGWKQVVDAVHAEDGLIIPQLWHIGLAAKSDVAEIYSERSDHRATPIGPSGRTGSGELIAKPMTEQQIVEVQEAYVDAAKSAFRLGFDGVEIHGAHGYLVDQFFWGRTNTRVDAYGGDHAARTRFAVEIIKAIRERTSPAFLISLRFSQWKMEDYNARAWPTRLELEQFLHPLVEAGVDVFHCSQRRYWEPEFEGSNLNLAGWTKKITGLPTISVGSVGVDAEFIQSLFDGTESNARSIADLLRRLKDDEFDLIAIGRSLIANPQWPALVQAGNIRQLRSFTREMLVTLD